MMIRAMVISLMAFALTACKVEVVSHQSPQTQNAHDFVAAFNDRDIDVMLALASADVQWINLDGERLSVEASDPKGLRESLTSYFETCPSCKSKLLWVKETPSRLIALEEASWTIDGEPRAQSSISVYEFEDGKIIRVYYFPAE